MKKKLTFALIATVLTGLMLFMVACGGAPRDVMNPPEDPMQLVESMRDAGWTVTHHLNDGVGIVSGTIDNAPASMPRPPVMPENPTMADMIAWQAAMEAHAEEIQEWMEANRNRRITMQVFTVQYLATEEAAIEAYDSIREMFDGTITDVLENMPDAVTFNYSFGRTGNRVSSWYSVSGRIGDILDGMPSDSDEAYP